MKAANGINKKAAILLFGIVARHPFLDGNKRTGLISTETFLRLNKKKLITIDKDI